MLPQRGFWKIYEHFLNYDQWVKHIFFSAQKIKLLISDKMKPETFLSTKSEILFFIFYGLFKEK